MNYPPAHFPPWAMAAILVATAVLSVATTLITLALEDTRRARRAPAAATRRYMIGAAVCGAAILTVMLSHVRPDGPPDGAIAACTSLSGLNQAGPPDFRRVRAEFATSRWPDVRADGMAYTDLAIKLRTAQDTDGAEAVWLYQRLSTVCARHNGNITADSK